MPPSLTSSFASAAAGGNAENGVRRDGSSSNEWSRNRPNGATQTFRRSSQAATQSRDSSQPAPTSTPSGAYIPPHLNAQPGGSRNGAFGDTRYNKDQLLNIYQSQRDLGTLNRNLSELFMGPWDVDLQSRNDGKEPGPEVCWNAQPDGDPFGMVSMSETERQLFTSVNSLLKQNQSKEGGNSTLGNRKSSLSNHQAYAANSGTVSRPGTRRRETSDSFTTNGPLSPSESKTFFRNETNTSTPPPALLRRRTDYKDEDPKEESKEADTRMEAEGDTQSPFGSLRRITTGPLSAGLNGPSSPWSNAPHSAFGSFGSFAVGGPATAQEAEKRPGFGSARSASRFKDLLAKSSTEDMSPSVKEKASFGALEKLPEEDVDAQLKAKEMLKNRPNRSETNPYDDGMPRSGSAALSQDGQGIEQMGFSSFGPSAIGSKDFGQSEGLQGTPQGRRHNDPLSPSNTNPYHSPAGRLEEEGAEIPGQPSNIPPFGVGRRDMFAGTHDRGQPFGPPRSGLGGLGGIGGWGAGFGGGTPGRERSAVSAAFGDPIFSPMADLQSPNAGFFGGAGFGSAGRSSRLGALFPPAMQDQMRSDSRGDAFENPIDSAGARDPFDSSARRQDTFRGLFEDAGRAGEGNFSPQPPSGSQSAVAPPGPSQRTSVGPEQASGHGMSQSNSSSSSSQMPAAQQRQMVMPDRMRWIYRDPQGNVQGPWSGLEMHDWFKAGFFTAELQVKKLEDAEYEPLAQLVRRIGNSREPFLVPQIGVPHGPPNSNQGNHWANSIGTGGTQPPFANSFPSFGTTLTAEQQNALERRKQEEQYLMARQKEHLAQQQMFMKQMQMQNPSGTHGLQHHSSAHSLHSQPSFGSITSPGGYQQSPMQAPIQPPQSMHGFSGPSMSSSHAAREDELPNMLDRMSFAQRSNLPFGGGAMGQPGTIGSQHQRQSHSGEMRAHEEAFLGRDGRNERLEEFTELREDMDDDQDDDDVSFPRPIGAQRPTEDIAKPAPIGQPLMAKAHHITEAELSLTQQVQRKAAENQKAAADEKIQPPPVSISPLPAPAAQRNRQHVADALAAGSRSATQTPVETPTSIAPWADKTSELTKGPSLREIQEAEAKRAAEQEGLLAAARRAQVEQERLAAAALPPPAPGLPSTSTWANSASPASPVSTASVWAKQTAKPVSAGPGVTKKTLAQIQKEEEARKQRAIAAAATQAAQAQAAAYNTNTVAGKRYAELASKVAPPSPQGVGASAWTTVGTGGGKAKTPATVVATPQATRTVSSSNVSASSVKTRPTLQATRTASVNNQSKAMDEFSKWAKLQLGNGLNSGINVDTFVQDLLMLPPEIDIIRDSVYASSQTLDGRRFAEEFVRRRKLADKGVVEPVNTITSGAAADSKSGAGGWSEVAKKGPTKEQESSSSAAFKVVAKKKGRK